MPSFPALHSQLVAKHSTFVSGLPHTVDGESKSE
jgi:hypothetical protein